MRKRLPVFLFVLTLAFGAGAQRLVQTIDNACYWTNSDMSEETLTAITNGSVYTIYIKKSDIAVVVDMEEGTQVLRPEELINVPPRAFTNGAADLFATTEPKVYVPITSNVVQQRWGARRLTELILEDGHWRLVATPEQADFILEYHFVERGSDRAYLAFRDRMDSCFLYSRAIPAKEWTPVITGIESAERLYTEYVRGVIFDNRLDNWGTASDTATLLAGSPEGFFLTGSLALGFTDDMTFAFSPKLQLNYCLNDRLSLGLGVAYLSLPLKWESMGTVSSAAGATFNYSLDIDAPKTVSVATLPITLNLHYLLTSNLYAEAAVGYALPALKREYNQRAEHYDDFGNLIYGDQTITSQISSFFLSAGFGFRTGNFDLGFTLQAFPSTSLGSDVVEVGKVDPFGNASKLDRIERENKGSVFFFGFKAGYNLFFGK